MLAMLLFFSVILITKVTYAAAAQPNLLFVLLDDHSTIDEGLDVMPNYAARFVTEGMRMSNAFAASPKCCPSRTSLLSGRFTHRLNDATYGWCGDYNSAGRYNGTWINTLREGGYSVGYFGIL